MKKFLYKTAVFVVPFLLIFLLSFKYYTDTKGDLLRLGFIADIYNYDFNKVFKKEMARKINYTVFSELNLKKQNNFTVFAIGDSFSEQGAAGYQNYLANNSTIKVLHYDRFLHENPIETVTGFLNGNVLDNIKVDYIILQSVERGFVERALVFNKKIKITNDSLTTLIKKHKEKLREVVKGKTKDKFFSRETLRFPLNAICYNFDDNAYLSTVYQVKTKNNLFSTNNHNLLFYTEDYEFLKTNNDVKKINILNNELNTLAKRLKNKGIKLIVLPCPDKLDFYYDEIISKDKYAKPIFFDCLKNLNKEYIYIDAKKVLQEKAKNKKDVYFYDDTHWSPIAAKIIGSKLDEIINTK
ncbi:hypothetical protein RYR30_002052 [Flavobacterium psychrophilum]|nr:hypothetical protein [Flavobacterium psychrophilum]ELM3672089.1 hypothetical protein [Flavobacterium psychrophilum]ELM3726884.1 hypothetical protein [Flavobacterium psychrophilum]